MSETRTPYRVTGTGQIWRPRPLIGEWTPDQARVAACFPEQRRVCVPAANGVGKTFLAADLVVSFILDHPGAAIIITAPTNRQVCELLWPHVSKRIILSGLESQEWQIPDKPKWSGGDEDTLIGFATNRPERMQGFHAEYLLIVVDEASGMPQTLIEALEGIANADNNYILAIGNPNQAKGAFFGMTRRATYRTEVISALTHPNITSRREIIPGATSWRSMVDRIRDWCKETPEPGPDTFTVEISEVELGIGPDTLRTERHFVPNDAFRIRYLGRFPNAASWTLITPRKLTAAEDAQIPGDRPRLAALDVARTGGDRTVYGLRAGDTVRSIRTIPADDLVKQAEYVASILRDDDPESIIVDAAGLGIGLVDVLRTMTDVPVIAFQPAAEPLSPAQQRKYFNRRAVAYGNLAIAFEEYRISLPKDTDMADELLAVTYKHTPSGQMQIGDKEEIKELLGRSPDVADMLALLWEWGTDFGMASAPAVVGARRVEEPW